MTIERTQPLKFHKDLLIRLLKERPEEFKLCVPNWNAYENVSEFIEVLEKHPGKWLNDGTCLTDAEWKERYGPMSRTSGARFPDPSDSVGATPTYWEVSVPVVTMHVFRVEADDREEATERAVRRYKDNLDADSMGTPYIDYDIMEAEEV